MKNKLKQLVDANRGRISDSMANKNSSWTGARITVFSDNKKDQVLSRFTVPAKFGGLNYCIGHPTGEYAKRLIEALSKN